TVGSNANALSFTISGQLFAGVGGTLSGTTIGTANATGFSGSVNTLTVNSISAPAKSWLGVDASGIDLALVGVDNVALHVTSGHVQLNKASGAAKLDWRGYAPSGLSLFPLAIADSLDLHVSGSVTLNAFGSLIATGTLDLNQGQVSDATVGTNANALSLTI